MASYVKDYVMDPSDSSHLFVDESLAASAAEKTLAANYNNSKAAEIAGDAYCALGELAALLQKLEVLHTMRTKKPIGYISKLKVVADLMNQNILR
jgi:hypothetical protein